MGFNFWKCTMGKSFVDFWHNKMFKKALSLSSDLFTLFFFILSFPLSLSYSMLSYFLIPYLHVLFLSHFLTLSDSFFLNVPLLWFILICSFILLVLLVNSFSLTSPPFLLALSFSLSHPHTHLFCGSILIVPLSLCHSLSLSPTHALFVAQSFSFTSTFFAFSLSLSLSLTLFLTHPTIDFLIMCLA